MAEVSTPAPAAATEEIVAIKGFDRDLRCRGFQFAIGGTYTHEGEVHACRSGFHAVEGYPLDVFRYYPPSESRYAEVRQGGDLHRDGDDSKVASARLTVVAEISLGDLVQRAVRWVMDRAKPEGETATGDGGAASATGYRGAASATGYRGAASATGDGGAASATGYRGAASATGDGGAASATGYRGAASATGDGGAASATGAHGVAMASGFDGRAMGAEGCALFLVRRDGHTGAILHVWAGIAGRHGIKPGVFYTLGASGLPVEVSADA